MREFVVRKTSENPGFRQVVEKRKRHVFERPHHDTSQEYPTRRLTKQKGSTRRPQGACQVCSVLQEVCFANENEKKDEEKTNPANHLSRTGTTTSTAICKDPKKTSQNLHIAHKDTRTISQYTTPTCAHECSNSNTPTSQVRRLGLALANTKKTIHLETQTRT